MSTGQEKSGPAPASVAKALEWVDSIRRTEGGFSENEKKLIVLADEVIRLRRLVKQVRRDR